jgi:hypothetical protein
LPTPRLPSSMIDSLARSLALLTGSIDRSCWLIISIGSQ